MKALALFVLMLALAGTFGLLALSHDTTNVPPGARFRNGFLAGVGVIVVAAAAACAVFAIKWAFTTLFGG